MSTKPLILSLALGFASLPALAAEPLRLYLANDDHTDYMWTADADTYGRVFVEMLEYHMKLADAPRAIRRRC